MIKNILVLCTGNICRSPLAAYRLRATWPDKKITSAGVDAVVGAPADAMVQKLLAEQGIDCSDHRGQNCTRSLILQSDVVFVMEKWQRDVVHRQAPESRGRVFLLAEFLTEAEIADPYGKDESFFRATLEHIDQAIITWQGKL